MNAAVERIKELKKERNITDGMIGEIIQYHPKSVNRMLNYQAKLPKDVIVPLSEYLNVSPEYLLGHSEFRTKEEEESHILNMKYKLIVDLVNSIKHMNLIFTPYLLWTKLRTTERARINYILDAADSTTICKNIDCWKSISDLISAKDYELYTFKEEEPIEMFFDYEKNHMNKGNFYLFHEIRHNGKRVGIISHEKFLYMIDNINNTIANTVALMLGFISTDI